MSVHASVCNNTVVMWLLFIELIVSFLPKNNTGKIYVTQGKLKENTGNFILARMWPPVMRFCLFYKKTVCYFAQLLFIIQRNGIQIVI